MLSPRLRGAALCGTVLFALACDRNIEPFVPGEEPREPDLSEIFPEGAERASRVQPGMPPAPGEARGNVQAAQAVPSDAAPIRGTLRLAPGLEPPPGAIGFLIARRGAGGPRWP